MDATASRLLDRSTWTLAALLVAGPPLAVLVEPPEAVGVAGFAFGTLLAVTVLNLGLVLAPVVAARHWLLRLPVAALMAPATAILSVAVVGTAVEGVMLGDENDFRVWALAPALLALCVYLSTLARLLAVGTPLSRLVRPAPRDEPAGWR